MTHAEATKEVVKLLRQMIDEECEALDKKSRDELLAEFATMMGISHDGHDGRGEGEGNQVPQNGDSGQAQGTELPTT